MCRTQDPRLKPRREGKDPDCKDRGSGGENPALSEQDGDHERKPGDNSDPAGSDRGQL